MNTARHAFAAALTAAALVAPATFAWAQDAASSVDIVRSTQGGHAYQNGGISHEEVVDMNEHMKPYDLRLTFSEGQHNAYVTGLAVQITDAAGRPVFSLNDAGPLTDVSLPAGHYRVVADFGGVKRSGSVDVKRGEPSHLYLHWARDET